VDREGAGAVVHCEDTNQTSQGRRYPCFLFTVSCPCSKPNPCISALPTHRRRTFCTAALLPCPGTQGEPLRPIHHAVDPAIKPWLNRAVSSHLVAHCLRCAAAQTRRRLSAGHRAMSAVFQVLLSSMCALPCLTTTYLCLIAMRMSSALCRRHGCAADVLPAHTTTGPKPCFSWTNSRT
jgi:hypothetical protein